MASKDRPSKRPDHTYAVEAGAPLESNAATPKRGRSQVAVSSQVETRTDRGEADEADLELPDLDARDASRGASRKASGPKKRPEADGAGGQVEPSTAAAPGAPTGPVTADETETETGPATETESAESAQQDGSRVEAEPRPGQVTKGAAETRLDGSVDGDAASS